MTDIKGLIERARSYLSVLSPHAKERLGGALLIETTDALESLTQPVGLEPVGGQNRSPYGNLTLSVDEQYEGDLFSETQLRQVMQERDDLEQELKHFRDNARPAFIRQTNDQNKITALEAENERLQPQVAMLREALEDCRGNINPERGYADELEADIRKALAATEPKGE